MPRFSALTLLVTVFYFLVWATQVSTPSHSDISLRTINIVPQLYPMLTISAPPPTRSPCAGINRCDKTPMYGTWASRFVRSVNQARDYLNVRNTIRPYLPQAGRYAHQVTEMLGRPTHDGLVGLSLMPTTGKAASPLAWARVEKASAARPSPPPPLPTRSLPVHFPPTSTTGPWNPPTATTGHSRPRHAEPVVEVDSDDWFQQALFIGSTLILAAMSFVWRFETALSSVKCVEHRNSESDGVVHGCDTISSVVPPTTETSVSKATQKPIIKPTVESQQNRPEFPLVAPPAAYPGPTTNQILDAVVRRPLTLVPTRIAPFIPTPVVGAPTLASRGQRSVMLRQVLRPGNTLNHIRQTYSLLVTTERHVSLLVEWHPNTTEERLEVVSPPAVALVSTNISTLPYHRTPTVFNYILPYPASWPPFGVVPCGVLPPVIVQPPCTRNSNKIDQGVVIRRRTPLLIEWRPEQKVTAILPSTWAVFGPPPPNSLKPTADHLYTTPTTQLSFHLLRAFNVPSYTHTTYIPSFDSKINRPPARLLIEWHPSPQVDLEPLKPSVPAPTPIIQPDPPPPPKPQAPLHIPLSFYRYGNIRLEDLDAYPPEKRHQKLDREIRLAEARYQHEKQRRDRARVNIRLMRSEMERKGKRLPKRRKTEEEIEEEEDMKRVMMARRRGKEEVFEGGGGPLAVSSRIQDWFDMLARECRTCGGKEKGSGKKKGKGKKVRWADDAGKSLVVERD